MGSPGGGVLILGGGLFFALAPLQTDKMADMLDGLLLQADDNDDDDDEGSVDDDSDLEVVEVDNVDPQQGAARTTPKC